MTAGLGWVRRAAGCFSRSCTWACVRYSPLKPAPLRLVAPHRCQHLLCYALLVPSHKPPLGEHLPGLLHCIQLPAPRCGHLLRALTVQLLAVRQVGLIGSAVGPWACEAAQVACKCLELWTCPTCPSPSTEHPEHQRATAAHQDACTECVGSKWQVCSSMDAAEDAKQDKGTMSHLQQPPGPGPCLLPP